MLLSARKYLRTLGGIFELMPSTNYSSLISKKSDAENIAADFQAIGDDIWMSVQEYEKGIRAAANQKLTKEPK